MIKTATSFESENKYLQGIFDSARDVLLSSVKTFGERRVLTTSADGDTMTLNSEVLGASTLACFDTEAALNTVMAFMATRRKDGRIADSIRLSEGNILPKYEILTGFCFAEEALGLYYLTRKKDHAYLASLLETLEALDRYLWEHHDLNFNNCLEVFGENEMEEGKNTSRFSPIKVNHYGEVRTVSPFPIETGDLMAFDVSVRHTIARIYSLKGDAARAREWVLRAIDVQAHMKQFMWVENAGACFDHDYRGSLIDVLTVNNLFMMYYGAFDREMADTFVSRHLMDPKSFGTAMPLPTISFRDRHFINDDRPNFNGQPRGMTYRRAIGALEKYGHFSLLSAVGQKFLQAVGEHFAYTEQFNPFTGEAVGKSKQSAYMPSASTALEFIARFFGVRPDLDRIIWGALGHEDGGSSTYRFTWGSEDYRVLCESETTTGFMGDRRLFTVTNGMRVVTDFYGDDPWIVNVTDRTIDGVFVYRDRTFSFTLAPNEKISFE